MLPRLTTIPGMIGARETVSLNVDPPIGEREQAVLLSPLKQQIAMETIDESTIRLISSAPGATAYVILVVPRALVHMAAIPWAELPKMAPYLLPQLPWGQIVAGIAEKFMGQSGAAYAAPKPKKKHSEKAKAEVIDVNETKKKDQS